MGPGPGRSPRPVPADSVFSADQIQRAEDYARWARIWGWSSLAVSLAVACWLGFSQRGRRLTDRIPGRWWVRVVLVVAALEVIGRLVTLPFAIAYRRLPLDVGLSTSSWPAWVFDLVKGELVDIVVTSLAVISLVGIARRWPRAWPAIAGGVLALFVVAFAYPLVIEPLFSSFVPLARKDRCAPQILELADREDVEVDEVLVADTSRRTTTLNAYVSGFGGTRRVVVYDTLVEDLLRRRRRCRWSPTSWPTPATTTCSSARPSGRPALCSAWACSACSPESRSGAGRPGVGERRLRCR